MNREQYQYEAYKSRCQFLGYIPYPFVEFCEAMDLWDEFYNGAVCLEREGEMPSVDVGASEMANYLEHINAV